MKLLYALGVRGYSFAIRIASLWNSKAKLWLNGRKDSWKQLSSWKRESKPVYWFHCASLGEFEQGRPIMERLKQNEDCQIVITFFSPSGYTIRKNYELADLIIYLPQETNKNVRRFLDVVQPDNVFFIKYEFWANYIFEAKKRGAKVYSVSATFRKGQLFFKWYGGYMRKVLQAFDHIFVQDEFSLELIKSLDIEGTHSGDTRYDRVMENAKKVRGIPILEKFATGENVLVIGSSWAVDDEVLLDCLNDSKFDWKVIMAPHEIDEKRLLEMESKFDKSIVRFSAIEAVGTEDVEIILIDNIGMLMNAYQYANLAYVGGAFGKGLHNILEPASFGVEVVFGPKHDKFVEADLFKTANIGFVVNSAQEFNDLFTKKKSKDNLNPKVLEFMNQMTGATDVIMDLISKK